ncbi:winged helix-turn-helix transcriptional regulator [Iodobacter sp. HSC-16F04]|uniref:Winged helix-turn-helix transcriptional regulator n=1 Tax=Iodobacter violaceini TaxID=3044271 RepID=A0ABX0KX30_9NEIS|nr:MarR family winged helix-turn-helix transcriptional regulator [Iodobacter violacea]NHQ88374.1 winged helix-turn-helix transcriptional regulator [Iodobacter violacea]
MDTELSTLWSDTPAGSERIVSAISRIASVLRTGVWQFATAEGLNHAQVEVLEILRSRSEGVRLSWIAQQLGVTAASASDSIAALVAKGLIEKGRAVGDGRAVALRLTSAGQALALKIVDATGFALEAVGRLPPPKQEQLFSSLLALIGQLQQTERFPELRACLSCQHFAANVHANSIAPHHCRLVDAPLSVALLRLDCPEHIQAEPVIARQNWEKME